MTATPNQPIEQSIVITQFNDVLVKSGTEFKGLRITHDGFSYDDIRQKYVQYAYKLGGFEFVRMIECENGNWNVHARGDSGYAYGLCQMNKRYHKDIPQEYYDGVWQVQLEYCYQKRSSGTKYYGPSRIIKGMRCDEYVKNRFTFVE